MLKRVKFELSYVVDGNNSDMVDHAKDTLFDDIMNLYKYDEIYESIEVVDAPDAKLEHIPEFLRMHENETVPHVDQGEGWEG